MQRAVFQQPGPIFLACVYLPSIGQNHDAGKYEQLLEELQQQTEQLSQRGTCIWAGDFNADVWHGSELPDGGVDHACAIQHAPEMHMHQALRGEPPRILKPQARMMLNAAAATGMLLLTGRKGDLGDATFLAATGRSRVDHIAVHHSLWRLAPCCPPDRISRIIGRLRPRSSHLETAG